MRKRIVVPAFAKNLRMIRTSRGLLAKDVAAHLKDIDPALLSAYEKGNCDPSLARLIQLCDYYDVSADFLLGRVKKPDAIVNGGGTQIVGGVGNTTSVNAAGQEQLAAIQSLSASVEKLADALTTNRRGGKSTKAAKGAKR